MEGVENLLVDLILNKHSGISLKLKEQEEELAGLECTDPEGAGAWLREFEAPVIVEILKSPADYFNERFPDIKGIDTEARARLAEAIIAHSESCPRCSRKAFYDRAFAGMVDGFIEENREELKRELDLITEP